VVIGYTLAREAAKEAGVDEDRLERLEHMILSHQGSLEFASPVVPSTPEAMFLHQCDLLDSKMGAVENALRNAGENDEFSDRLLGTGSQILLTRLAKPKRTSALGQEKESHQNRFVAPTSPLFSSEIGLPHSSY
jgi:3'-5' exoribonuclease